MTPERVCIVRTISVSSKIRAEGIVSRTTDFPQKVLVSNCFPTPVSVSHERLTQQSTVLHASYTEKHASYTEKPVSYTDGTCLTRIIRLTQTKSRLTQTKSLDKKMVCPFSSIPCFLCSGSDFWAGRVPPRPIGFLGAFGWGGGYF